MVPRRILLISANGIFSLCASSDGEIRSWNLKSDSMIRRFQGHTDKVLSVSISKDDRRIVSASSDHSIRLWNTIGDCKHTLQGHKAGINRVRFVPNREGKPIIVSSSLDNTIKINRL
uniref:guanine nucleotide-binding protein subunit beta-like protein n=1 Tax=Erigeron canadensis TaxID=72917 RepID=UPI001CB8D325|nr:guanine nucleotide-binding protein subunit beta-like protein [Erigeron canadensis]